MIQTGRMQYNAVIIQGITVLKGSLYKKKKFKQSNKKQNVGLLYKHTSVQYFYNMTLYGFSSILDIFC